MWERWGNFSIFLPRVLHATHLNLDLFTNNVFLEVEVMRQKRFGSLEYFFIGSTINEFPKTKILAIFLRSFLSYVAILVAS
jgi:hypothetical protein